MIAMLHEMINMLEPCVPDWDPAHIRSQQLMDSDLEMIRTAVGTATKPLPLAARAFSLEGRAYVGLFEQLFFDEHNVLCRRIPQPNSAQLQEPLSEVQRCRTCLPKHLWETAIEYANERTSHQGAAATTDKLRNVFFFPFMMKEVAEMVEACEVCQMKTRRGTNDQRHIYATTSRKGYPFQLLSIDLVGSFPMSPEGYTHLLTVRCTFSKRLEAFPLKDEKATSVVEVLEREREVLTLWTARGHT
jgi:hypothetical protein